MISGISIQKSFVVFAVVCITAIAGMLLGNEALADKKHGKRYNHEVCHKHWHKHHKDRSHRHKHCHHHKHKKKKRRHDDDHDRGRGRGHDRDDDHYDDDHGRDDRHRDRDHRDDDRRDRGDQARLPVPPPPVTPPSPPTPWSIAKKIGKKVHFTKSDRSQIKRHYRKPTRRLKMLAPPSPPPGIDNLARKGAVIPPAVKIRGLSSRLKGKLSALPSGHKYGHLGRMVIIYNKRTRIIKDVKRAF